MSDCGKALALCHGGKDRPLVDMLIHKFEAEAGVFASLDWAREQRAKALLDELA